MANGKRNKMKKAIVLISGGLDSTVTLYWAKSKGYQPYGLIFDYGQRHRREISGAIKIAKKTRCKYRLLKFTFPWGGSALLEKKTSLPRQKNAEKIGRNIPSTYVPARNTIFLSFALSYAEVINAEAIFIGANALDFSGYPDCRPEYFTAFREVAKRATSLGFRDSKLEIKIHTPLINKTKAQIVKLGMKLKVPFELTWSCYAGGRKPCGKCDSCLLRNKGFREAGIIDPLYRSM